MNESVRTVDEKASDVLRKLVVWDNHACMPLRPLDTGFLPQLERLRQAGVTVASLNVGFGEQGISEHIRMLAHFRHWLGTRGDCYRVVKTPADILAAKENGQLGICFDIEGMNALDDQLSLIQLYYDLGVRWMLIAYNKNNRAGGGCHDEDAGLTAFGRQAIEEMARVGMVLCCSHAGYRTAREAIEFSPGPVIFSHSNPRALWNHPRNISDELIRACAARGGVIGISGIGIFLGSNDNATDTLVRHIDHVVQSVGDDHVALGLDYVFDLKELDEYLETMKATFPSTTYQPAMGMKMVEPERLPRLVEAMMTRGYSTVSLGKILGGNWLRIAQTVWKC